MLYRSFFEFNKIFYSIEISFSTVQYSTVQYSTVQYSTVQYSTVLHNNTVQYSADNEDPLPQHPLRGAL